MDVFSFYCGLNRKGCIASVLAGVVILMTAAAPVRANLLTNGDFNTDADGDGSPDGWSSYSFGDNGYASYKTSPTDPYSYNGTPYVNAGNSGDYFAGGGGWNQVVAGVAGDSYTETVESASETFADGSSSNVDGEMRLIYLDSAQAVIRQDTVTTENYVSGAPWTFFTQTTVSPTGTAYVKFEVAGGGRGTALFDNATLVDNSAIPEPASFGVLTIGASALLRRRRR